MKNIDPVILVICALCMGALILAYNGLSVNQAEAQSKPYSAYPVPGSYDVDGIERNTGCLYVVGMTSASIAITYSPFSCPK